MIQDLTDHAEICDRPRFCQCLQDHLSFQSNDELSQGIEITGVGRLQTLDVLFSIIPGYNDRQVPFSCQMPGLQRSVQLFRYHLETGESV